MDLIWTAPSLAIRIRSAGEALLPVPNIKAPVPVLPSSNILINAVGLPSLLKFIVAVESPVESSNTLLSPSVRLTSKEWSGLVVPIPTLPSPRIRISDVPDLFAKSAG